MITTRLPEPQRTVGLHFGDNSFCAAKHTGNGDHSWVTADGGGSVNAHALGGIVGWMSIRETIELAQQRRAEREGKRMTPERYPGELGALRSFLANVADIRPDQELLTVRINRAIAANDIRSLRQARLAYNQYPVAFRNETTRRMFSGERG